MQERSGFNLYIIYPLPLNKWHLIISHAQTQLLRHHYGQPGDPLQQ